METCEEKIGIKTQKSGALEIIDYRKADGIGVGDAVHGELRQPCHGDRVMGVRGKYDRGFGAGHDPVERESGRGHANSVQNETMNLREHKIRRGQEHVSGNGLPEKLFGFGMVLVASAEESNPCARIHKNSISAGAAFDRAKLLFPQRSSPPNSRRCAR